MVPGAYARVFAGGALLGSIGSLKAFPTFGRLLNSQLDFCYDFKQGISNGAN